MWQEDLKRVDRQHCDVDGLQVGRRNVHRLGVHQRIASPIIFSAKTRVKTHSTEVSHKRAALTCQVRKGLVPCRPVPAYNDDDVLQDELVALEQRPHTAL